MSFGLWFTGYLYLEVLFEHLELQGYLFILQVRVPQQFSEVFGDGYCRNYKGFSHVP